MIEFFVSILEFFIHLDQHFVDILFKYQDWTYLLLFLTIFCETGLIVTPFLPGDSLIFVVGTFAARDWMNVWYLYGILMAAAILGNTVNYSIGIRIGPKAFEKNNKLLKKAYLEKTQRFFDKYGSKTIVIARFLPIVRTVAPFLAGVGQMNYVKYTYYNVIGCVAWVTLFLFGGYFFGNLPIVKRNITWVIIGIILVSFIPTIYGALRRKIKPVAAEEPPVEK